MSAALKRETGVVSRGENGSKLHLPKPASKTQKTDDFPPVVFCRDDWMEFRDPNRISIKAGVPFEQLPKVVAKELCDDALDAAGAADFGLLSVEEDSLTFFV